jgi:glutamate transport system substrate-binding protein
MVRSAHRKMTTVCLMSVAIVLLANLCACESGPGGGSGTKTDAAAHGPLFKMNRVLRIGVKTDEPGLGFVDITGNTGLDIDIAREIAAALDDGLIFQSVYQNAEQMINSGAVDLVIASYSITESRLTQVSFAGPYLLAGQDILVRQADAAAYSGVDSLQNKKVCTVEGTASYQRLQDHFSKEWAADHIVTTTPDGKPVLDYPTCVKLLLANTVDAVSTDDAVLAAYVNQYQGRLHLVGKRFSREKYGIGLAKGDTADAALINTTLARMIQNGHWADLVKKNLGATAELFLKPENKPAPPTGQ